MATVSLIGGGSGQVEPVVPYPYGLEYWNPPVGAGGSGSGSTTSNPFGGIVDIIRALGDAIGGILNPPSVTPLPPGAGVGAGSGGTVIAQSTVIQVAIIIAVAYVIAKK